MKRSLVFLLALAALFALLPCGAWAAGSASFRVGDAPAEVRPVPEDGRLTLPAAPEGVQESFVGWVRTDLDAPVLYPAGAVVDCGGASPVFEALVVSLRTLTGAAVPLDGPVCLRFDGALPEAEWQRLTELAGEENLRLGIVSAPARELRGAAPTRGMPAAHGADDASGGAYISNGLRVFHGRTGEIAPAALADRYAGRAYLSVTMGGTTVTVYAPYDSASHVRTAVGVSAAAYEDREPTADGRWTESTDTALGRYYSPYTAAERDVLRARLDRVVHVDTEEEGGAVAAVYTLENRQYLDCRFYVSPYRVDRFLRDTPQGYDTYVVVAEPGADIGNIAVYFVGGSQAVPTGEEKREDGYYISLLNHVSN